MSSHSSITRRGAAEGEQAGFTLIEMLVVIVILGIIAAVVVIAVGGIGDRGEDSACVYERRVVATAVEAYRADDEANALPDDADWDDLVPTFLEDEPTMFAYSKTGPDTYDVVATAAGGC